MKNSFHARAGFTLVEIMVVVVIVGLLTMLAIPAFQKVRANSQDKAVFNNLRQLSTAANQYFLENGVTEVETSVLVGSSSTQYIRQLATIASETYASPIKQGEALSATGVGNARTITYSN